MSKWEELSLPEQAEMIGVAVKNGYTNLSDIRQKYNEFAEGGSTDEDLVDWIIREEGFIGSPQDIGDGKMTLGSGLTSQKWHDQYKRNGNRWTIDDNRKAVKEEVANRRKWAEQNIPNWDSLPSSSQKALISYKYNYDFNRANSPKLFKALADSNLQEAARQMDATSSNAMFRKGLQGRRQREQEWFLRDVISPQMPNTFYQPAVSTQVYNPYIQQAESTRILPTREPDPNSYIRTREVSPKEQRKRKFQENVEAYQRFNALMNLIDIKKNPAPSYVPNHPLFELVNGFATGGEKDSLSTWNALKNIDYTEIPDTAFTKEKTGAGSIEVMFKDTPKEGYEYGTGYKYPHPMPGHNVVIYNPKDNDAQDIRLDALHIMPQDATYDALRSELAYYADDSDISVNAEERMKDDIKKYGHPIPGMTYQDYFNNEVDGLLRNMFIEGSPEYIASKRYYPNQQQLREWNKELMPYIDRIHNYLLTGRRPANVLPEIIVTGKKHSIGGPLVEATMNEYKNGGPIHIKPENRGKFTALKERTGHSATWFKEHGTPAQKKMATFALNARKWKHGLGGNLFSGEENHSQQMNIFRKPNGEYFYQASPDSEEVPVTPLNTLFDNPALWTYTDNNGKLYTPRQSATSTQGEVIQAKAPSTWENIVATSNNNYMDPVLGAPARWKESWNNDTNPVKALWNSPLVMANPYLLGAKTVSNLVEENGIPKTARLYSTSNGSDNGRWMWQRSLVGDALEASLLFPAAAEGYQLGKNTIQRGRRFVQNIEDRYQGMKDAANFAANKTVRPNDLAADITNYIWLQRQGNIASDRALLPSMDGGSGLRDASGAYYHQTTTKGGNQTINVHLGGTSTGDKPWELKAMEPSRVRWLNEYLETAPQGTIFGEIGGTKNYAEQYTNVKPSWYKAAKDAIFGKNEYNPYWGDYEESLMARIAGSQGNEEVMGFYSNLMNNNNPLSVDSYKMMLDLARKGKYDLRYDSSPMGLFNSQGVRQRDFYNSLLDLSPEDKVDAINVWMSNIYPKARPAYLEDGEIIIPRPLLIKKTPSKNTWLRK